MDGLALAFALGAPLAGAVVLVMPPVAVRPRAVTTIALGGAGLAAAGGAALLLGAGVMGGAARAELSLGPLDPDRPGAAAAWTVAPLVLGVVFAGIAIRRQHRAMLGLALAGLLVSGAAAFAEVGAGTAQGLAAQPTARGALLVDPLAAALLLVTLGVGGLIVVHATGYEPAHLRHRRLPMTRTAAFLAWLLAFLVSMQLLVLADDLRVLVVGWELTTLCCFTLIAFDGDAAAFDAADRALVYNLAGGVALGAALLVAGPGARLSSVLVAATTEGGPAAWVPACLAGAIGAAAVKSALIPFQGWLLGAMVASAPVSALLHASTMVNAGCYLVLRLSPALAADGRLGPALALLGGTAFAGAAFLALRERDLKRVLAFSTVSTLGLTVASAGLASPAAMAAGTTLLVFHAAAKGLAFLSVGTIEQAAGSRDVELVAGIARRAPLLGGPLLVAAAAMVVPPSGVAVAKWAMLELSAADVVLAALLAAGATANLALWTLVAARLIVRRAGPAEGRLHRRVPRACGASIALLAVICVGGMAAAGPVMELIGDPAAAVAFGRSPGLASGWSIALRGGAFAVPFVALCVAAAIGLGWLAAGRVRRTARDPYLSGATMGPGGRSGPVFHGPRGEPVGVRTGGFYFGAGSSPALAPRGPAQGPGGLARLATVPGLAAVAGWVAVGVVVAAALASAVGAAGRVAP